MYVVPVHKGQITGDTKYAVFQEGLRMFII